MSIPYREVTDDAADFAPQLIVQSDTVPADMTPVTDEPEDLSVSDDEPRPIALVIDDNSDVRLLLRSLLGDRYRVLTAADGREGLDKAQATVPDIIVCDVMMPVMDGLECCRLLKSGTTTSHIPVLMLTACSMDEQRVRGLEEGADAYIAKPFSGAVLLAQIDSLIQNHRRVRDFYSQTTALSTAAASDDTTPDNAADATASAATTTVDAAEPMLSRYDKEFLDKLHVLIDKNIGNEQYSVELLASDICLSRTQLFRKAKALTGESPVELLRNTRLNHAKQLLAQGRVQSIAEVASLVGFSDASYFSRCYKAYFGTTPRRESVPH